MKKRTEQNINTTSQKRERLNKRRKETTSSDGFAKIAPIFGSTSSDGFAKIAPIHDTSDSNSKLAKIMPTTPSMEKRNRDYLRMRASPIVVPRQEYDHQYSRPATPPTVPALFTPIQSNSSMTQSSSSLRGKPRTLSDLEKGIASGRTSPASLSEYMETLNEDAEPDDSNWGIYDKDFHGGKKRKSRRVRKLRRTRRKKKGPTRKTRSKSKSKSKSRSRSKRNKSKSRR